MARPLRIEYEGAWYHVMNRGAGRRNIFRVKRQREYFLALLADLAQTFGVETHAYCLMGNHYHLLLHTPRGNLSRAMRHLNGVYTQRYNRSEGTDGPLFRGRFKAILVDADGNLAQVSRYIHLNPVDARLVKAPADYRWSSYLAYVGQAEPEQWLRTEAVLALFGTRGARRRYRAFVELGVDEELRAFYGAGRQAPVLGTDAFREHLRAGRLPEREVPETMRITTPPSIEQIAAVTAHEFGVSPDQLHQTVKGARA